MNTKIHLHSYREAIALFGNHHEHCKINYILRSGKIAFSDDVYSSGIGNIYMHARIEFFGFSNYESITNMFDKVVKETI